MAQSTPKSEGDGVVGSFVKGELETFKKNWGAFWDDKVSRTYVKQVELSAFKAEANLVTGNFTIAKFEHTVFDPIQAIKDKIAEGRARARNELPSQLREDIELLRRRVTTVAGDAGKAQNTAEEAKRSLRSMRAEAGRDLQGVADEFERIENRVESLVAALGGL
ncbi:hypothetical protein [Streptomyces sp. NPDC048650]|uniref:hypothetical protein n=1 Tax=unclassified Streptomyces TaxID=2593676 RepID=UPI003714E369